MKKQFIKRSAVILIAIAMILAMISCGKNENQLNNVTQSEKEDTNSAIASFADQEIAENSSDESSASISKNGLANGANSSKVTSNNTKSSSKESNSDTNVTQTLPADNRYNAGDVNYPTRPAYNIGNCNGRLAGNQMVVLFFMDDDMSSWNDNAIQYYTKNQVVPGLEYLKSNAKKWGVNLDFTIKSYSSFSSGVDMKYKGSVTQNLRISGSTKDVLDNAARNLGYESSMKLNEALKAQNNVDKIIFLLLLNNDGVSYARNLLTPGYTSIIEHAVLFRDYLNESEGLQVINSRSTSIAHEVLHLFGAEDFYVSTKRETLANKLYPNDIMLLQLPEINRNTIGDVTAYSVGWTDEVPSVCNQSDWWG